MAACASRPNFANCDRACPVARPVAVSNESTRVGASLSTRRSCASSPTTTLEPSRRVPAASGRRPSRVSTTVVFPDPFSPTSATRSAQPMSRVKGPRVSSPRRTTASSSRATTAPERAASLMANRRSHPSQGFSTTSSASRARSDRRARAASFSVRLMRKSRCALSLSRGWRRSRLTPVVAHWRSRWARDRSSVRWAWYCDVRLFRRVRARPPAPPGSRTNRPRRRVPSASVRRARARR